ncbi:MAG: hypothetical protein ACTSQK_12060 [Candidatus Heimdallarchaeota archaeon]
MLSIVLLIVGAVALEVFWMPMVYIICLMTSLPAFFFGLDRFMSDNDKRLWDNIVELIASMIVTIRVLFNKEVRKKQRDLKRKQRKSKRSQKEKLLVKKVRKLPPETHCQISKLKVYNPKEVLQCSKCGSYYDKTYLYTWLQEKSDCPVCKNSLKKKK